jgi:hypothetical protein
LCAKHYRFGQMRAGAKRHGKAVPDRVRLEAMAPDNMECQDCGRTMNWLAKDGQSTVASLQHYRSGEMGIVCRACNTRHAHYPGDSFRGQWREKKWCPKCSSMLDRIEFAMTKAGLKSWCRACAKESGYNWRNNNKAAYNEYQRNWRAANKAN